MSKKKNAKIFSFVIAAIIASFVFYNSYVKQDTPIQDTGSAPVTEAQINDLDLDKDIEELIKNTKVGEPNYSVKYDRDEYESPIRRYEYNGEKYRLRDFSFYVYSDGQETEIQDPYSDDMITRKEADYEHIVPLSYAHTHGGYKLDAETKNTFAFDLSNGVPASRIENQIKSDSGPSEYLPEKDQDRYCYSFFLNINKYDLYMEQKDIDVCAKILEGKKDVKPINERMLDYVS